MTFGIHQIFFFLFLFVTLQYIRQQRIPYNTKPFFLKLLLPFIILYEAQNACKFIVSFCNANKFNFNSFKSIKKHKNRNTQNQLSSQYYRTRFSVIISQRGRLRTKYTHTSYKHRVSIVFLSN